MTSECFEEYWQAITKLEAQKMLSDFTVADYPHLKNNQRQDIYKKINNLAYFDRDKKYITFEELDQLMR